MQPGAVLAEAWELYKAHWRHFIVLALVFYVVLSLVTLVLALTLSWLGVIIGTLVALVGVFWLQGALVEAISDVRDGRADLSIADTFRRVQPRVGTLLGAGLLAGLGILVGLLLLIVPGLVLLTWWSLIVPVIVLERAPIMAAFGRSRELVRGNGWNVFAVIILTVLLSAVVGIILGIALLWLPDWAQNYIADVIGGAVTAPFAALAWTLMYYRLSARETPGEPVPATA